MWHSKNNACDQPRNMRESVLFYVNGRRNDVAGNELFVPLSEYLRWHSGLVGTKVVCSEGDCGACSVLLGRLAAGRLRYQVVDSCILFLFQIDGCHVVTVEGVAADGDLNAVQRALVDCHGSQCGFCTPGFAVALTGLLEESRRLDEPALRIGLTGNLCRCTGYTPILEAALQSQNSVTPSMAQLYNDREMREELARGNDDAIRIATQDGEGARLFFSPTRLGDALEFLADYPEATVVAGATDVGVQINKGRIAPRVILDLNRVAELAHAKLEDGAILAGARATWTKLEQLTETTVPELHKIIRLFGAPQIRNLGTIGGNIVNASPIADSVPFLYVAEAELELRSSARSRTVNINDFYRGYKQTDLRPGELLTAVKIPLPADDCLLRLYKVSKRRDLDIAGFTAAILLRINGGVIDLAAVALGAVGPTVIRARETEEFLEGRPFSEETMQAAGDVAVRETSPLSDVRGSREYRNQLTRNIFLKFYHEAETQSAQLV